MKQLKPRVAAFTVLGIWSILVAWVSYMYLTQPSIQPISSRGVNSVTPQQLQNEIAAAETTLESLARLKTAEKNNPQLKQIVHHLLPIIVFTPEQRASIEAVQGGKQVTEHQPVISMIIISNKQRGALVDGSYVREGEKLKNGALIEKIHNHSITLRDSVGLNRELRLHNAFAEQNSEDTLTSQAITPEH